MYNVKHDLFREKINYMFSKKKLEGHVKNKI